MQDLTGRGQALRRQPSGRYALPIGIYLFVLALVALVPAFLFSAILLQRNNEAQVTVVKSLMQATSQALASAVDRQVQGMTTTLRVLSTSQSLNEGNLQAFHGRATKALADSQAYISLLDEKFEQLLNTRVAFGTSLLPATNTAAAALALQSGQVVVSDVVFGRTAQAFVFSVFMPVNLPTSSGRVLALTQNADTLSPAITSRELPEGWSVALIDGVGKAITASAESRIAIGDVAPLQFNSDVPARPAGWRQGTINGTDVIVVTWKVPNTGWQIAAWAPRTLVERPFSDAVWSLIFGGLVLAGLVAAIVWWITNRIATAVQGVAADAHRLGAGEGIPQRQYPIVEIATVADAIADAARERRAAETEVKFLMRELAHRSKNQMTVIAAMAKQSAKNADSVPEFVDDFERRIFGLARSTDLLLANGANGVDLRELWSRQIDPFCPLDSGRVTLSGAPLRLNNQSAQILGMAAHELATNAVKYGAFSREDGTLEVSWERGEEHLHVSWREHIRALGKRAERRGFGTVVLENMVGSALGAEVVRTIHPDGIEWTFDIPVANIDPTLMPNPAGAAVAAPPAESAA